MRNLLSMAAAPRDGTGGPMKNKPRFIVQFADGDLWDIAAIIDDPDRPVHTLRGRYPAIVFRGWYPLPGSPPLPMSTAPKDGRRIQVKVFRDGNRTKAQWEHVEWQLHDGGEMYWWGDWMAFADSGGRDESGWLGWWPCPGED